MADNTKTIGIVMIVIGIVAIISIVGCVIFGAIGNSSNPPPYNPDPTPIPTPIQTQNPYVPDPTVITTPISTQNPYTPSRGYKDDFTIQVLNEISGASAWNAVWGDNPFVTPIEPGKKAYLLKVMVTCNQLGEMSYSDGASKVTDYDIVINMYGDNYWPSYLPSSKSSEYPAFTTTYFYEGQSTIGWLYYEVPSGQACLTMDSWRFNSNKVQL